MTVKHATLTAKSDNPAYDVSANEWNAAHDVTCGAGTVAAGDTYVDVAHNLGAAPSINKIQLTPQDNLDGRDKWVSDVGAVTFRINISSLDITDNHVFSWIIL